MTKQRTSILQFLLLVITGLMSTVSSSAITFEVANEDGVVICYDTGSSSQYAGVVARSNTSPKYSGVVNIPENVRYNGIDYIVNEIKYSAFKDCVALTAVSIPSTVTSLGDCAFQGCVSLTNLTIPNSVINIGAFTFDDCNSLQSVSLPQSLIAIPESMFSGCSALQSIEIPNSVIAIGQGAFYGCNSLKTVRIPSSVKSIGMYAFKANGLESIVSMIKTPFPVTDESGHNGLETFSSKTKKDAILYVPTGTKAAYETTAGWEFANIEEMPMEEEPAAYAVWCDDNKTLYFLSSKQPVSEGEQYNGHIVNSVWSDQDITATGEGVPAWNRALRDKATTVVFDESFKSVMPTSTFGWFASFKNLTTMQGLEYMNTSKSTSMLGMFYHCAKLKSLDLSSFNTSAVTDMSAMFNGCSSLTSLNLSNFDTGNVTTMQSMFYECKSLENLDVSNFDTRNVKSMAWMFYMCESLRGLDLRNFNTSNVEDMRTMFGYCRQIKNAKLNHWDTRKVTSLRSLFINCDSLRTVDLSGFNTEQVTTMKMMFRDCKKLVSVNLSDFDTHNVEDMDSLFYGCTKLRRVYVGENWTTKSVTTATKMFDSCFNIEGEKGTRYDKNYTGLDYARIDTGNNPGYFVSAELANETIMVNLTLTCTGDGAMVFNGNTVRKTTETFKVPLGSTVTVNLVVDENGEILEKSINAGHLPVSVGINDNQLSVYDILEDATLKTVFKDRSAIDALSIDKDDDDSWYSLEGIRLEGKPSQNGIYLYRGKKVAINSK